MTRELPLAGFFLEASGNNFGEFTSDTNLTPLIFAPVVSFDLNPVARPTFALADADYGPQDGEARPWSWWPTPTPRRRGFGIRARSPRQKLKQKARRRPGRARRRSLKAHSYEERTAELRRRAEPGRQLDTALIFEASRAAVEHVLPVRRRRSVSRFAGLLCDRHSATAEELDLVAEHAISLLAQEDCCPGVGPEELRERVRRAVDRVRAGYDVRLVRDEHWFGRADRVAGRKLIRRLLTNNDAQQLTRAARRFGYTLTRAELEATLTEVLLAASKAVLRNADHAVPVKWLRNALATIGVEDAGDDRLRRLASEVLLAALIRMDLLRCTDAKYAKDKAKRYAIVGDTKTLPFVRRTMSRRDRYAAFRLLAEAARLAKATKKDSTGEVADRPPQEFMDNTTPMVPVNPIPAPLWPSDWPANYLTNRFSTEKLAA